MFIKLKTEGKARRGQAITANGPFETPNFMPVGTQGSVKGIDCEEISEIGAEIILVNTYHLWVRPGPEKVKALGGIHKFTSWDGPILSDSGGFQVFSLESIRKITEEGVKFKSHVDGEDLFLTPEKAIQIQETLGVDIAMVLDECPAGDTERGAFEKSLAMTNRWAKRCLEARTRDDMKMFGITQGGVHKDLRTQAAEEIGAMGFDGCAIGGLSVGEPQSEMYEVLEYHPSQLPDDGIRYLMGVGTPEDIVFAVRNGVDLFDCVMPTRSGRFGRAFIKGTPPYINIKNAKFSESTIPLDEACSCKACRNYSRGYIHHLFKVGEMLGPVLVSLHNLSHYLNLMKEIRSSIETGSFEDLYKDIRGCWKDVKQARNETD